MMLEHTWSKRSTSTAKRNARLSWRFSRPTMRYHRWILNQCLLNRLASHLSFFNCSSIGKQPFIRRSNSKLDWSAANRWTYGSLFSSPCSSLSWHRSFRLIGCSTEHRSWICRTIHAINNALLTTPILWRSMMFPTKMSADSRWTPRMLGAKRHAPLNCSFHPQRWTVSVVIAWTRSKHGISLHELCRSNHTSRNECS